MSVGVQFFSQMSSTTFIVMLHLIGQIGNYQVSADVVNMRIVDEPTSYSWQQNNENARAARLTMRVSPSPFSGPEHFRRLQDKCFTKTIEKYEYKFCPFANLTQKEVGSNSWNPYHGILGVWQEWSIADNQFTAMRMLMGDQCGLHPRQVQVKFKCGNTSEIVSVSEPLHCEYELIFSTPLTCHNDSMLVYPTLDKKHQQKWNQLLGELKHEHITDKGYNKGLEKIFQSVGYKLKPAIAAATQSNTATPAGAAAPAAAPAGPPTPQVPGINANLVTTFTDLDSCNRGYESLRQELEQTKSRLQSYI